MIKCNKKNSNDSTNNIYKTYTLIKERREKGGERKKNYEDKPCCYLC